MYLSSSHFVCHRDPSSWALGSVHRTRLYTSEFFSSVSTCGKKRQNPLSPTFCPRTYFFTFVVHTRIYLILQRGWSSFLLSGFTVLPLPASVGSILWPYSLETAPPAWDSLQCIGLSGGCSSGVGLLQPADQTSPKLGHNQVQVERSMLSATELGLLEIARKNRQLYIAHELFIIEVQLIYNVVLSSAI